MAKSFRLDDGDDGDAALSLALFVIVLPFSLVNLWIRLPIMVVYPAPLIAFLMTRWAYKRHFKRRMAALRSQLMDPPEKALP